MVQKCAPMARPRAGRSRSDSRRRLFGRFANDATHLTGVSGNRIFKSAGMARIALGLLDRLGERMLPLRCLCTVVDIKCTPLRGHFGFPASG